MEKKENLILKGLVGLILLLFLVVLIMGFFMVSSQKKQELSYKEKVELLTKKFEYSKDSLDRLIADEQKNVIMLSDSINVLEKQSKQNKKRYEKDITTIDNNTLGQDLEFFSNSVPSSEGNR